MVCAGVCKFTSFLQVLQRPEHRVGQLALNVVEGSHATAGLLKVRHLGAKFIHDVPHWNLLLCGLQRKTQQKEKSEVEIGQQDNQTVSSTSVKFYLDIGMSI